MINFQTNKIIEDISSRSFHAPLVLRNDVCSGQKKRCLFAERERERKRERKRERTEMVNARIKRVIQKNIEQD